MNAFQKCPNTADLVPFYLPQQLYLRPISKLTISLQLPNVKKICKSVSHWEIMDNLRSLIRPDEFTVLKVTKTTVEYVRFEAEVEKKSKLNRVISKLDKKYIKLKEFDKLCIRAGHYNSNFPSRRVWDAFFAEARDMNEMKPGERPDTIHLSHLPSKWFVPYHGSGDEILTPSEKMFYKIFEKFGSIRHVDIPICDPFRKKMKEQISGFKYSSDDNAEFFEGYIQFKDYIGFSKTMDALRDMKLVRKDDDETLEIDIKVDFDKSKHLSDASIRRREIVRDRLMKKAKEQEERDKEELDEKKRKEEAERQKESDIKKQKELRRRIREEKRKAKLLKKLEISGSDEINEKIAREEKKLVKAQRKLEAIRLVEELFRRIKEKSQGNIQLYDSFSSGAHEELKRFKNNSELDFLTQREKLHHALKGRLMLKSILSDTTKIKKYSSSDSELSLEEEQVRKPKLPINMTHSANLLFDQNAQWFPYPYNDMCFPPIYPDYPIIGGYQHRGRGRNHVSVAGPSRGRPFRRGGYRGRSRARGTRRFPPGVEEQYQKYFRKFLDNHSPRRDRSRSYSRSRSRSRRSRSYSRSRSRDRRKSESGRSQKRSRSRSSRRRSKSRSRSSRREKSVDSTKFVTMKQFKEQKQRSRTRSRSWSMPKDGKTKQKSWSRSPEKDK